MDRLVAEWNEQHVFYKVRTLQAARLPVSTRGYQMRAKARQQHGSQEMLTGYSS